MEPALAAEPATVDFSVEQIVSDEWRIEELSAAFQLSSDGMRGEFRIRRIEVPAAQIDLSNSVLTCGQVKMSRGWLRCHEAVLTADFPVAGRHSVTGRFDYARDTGVTHFDIPRLPLAGSSVSLRGHTGEAGSTVHFAGQGLTLAKLIGIANILGIGPGELTASGTVDLDGRLRSEAKGTLFLESTVVMSGVSVSNEAGTVVADAVNGSAELLASRDTDGWRFDTGFMADRGEAYVEPVYANLTAYPLRLLAHDVRSRDFMNFDIGRFEFEQSTRVSLSGAAAVSLPSGNAPFAVHSATIRITATAVDAIYSNLLQVMAAGTLFGDMETAGHVAGQLRIADNAVQSASLDLDDVILDDRQRRFALYGLSGAVNWPGPDGEPQSATPSKLRWDSGNAYGVLFDRAEVSLRIGGDDLLLLEPLRLPTMGGALRINRLEVHDYGREESRGLLDAELEPVQLGQLTGAFGWPAFSGSLSGRLPHLQYAGNAMTVGGSLTAKAFDGDIEVSNLRIAQPFGRVPRLTGDVRLRQLDLERLTNTFSFGLIQGRLSGDVTGLRMSNWQPVAMDLHLYSSENDRTPHRISQRAVENLASVGGGGAGAVLSTGLLKFFEVFAYDRIGLRCLLRDGVCAMSGAGPATEGALGRGYYIVKGRGLPRIDVIGYRERVGWQALVQQLSGITRSTAPVVN